MEIEEIQRRSRGRPRKYPIDTAIATTTTTTNMTTAATPLKAIKTITASTPTTPVYEEKPREERSYKDFFPDLNIKEPLTIVKINKIDSNDHHLNVEENTMKSPSNDEYETASEGELMNEKRSKKNLPIASFHKIGLGSDSAHDESEEEQELLDSSAFIRPENHYIRYIEPSETELFETVEYDMDEQDEMWLKIYNSERKKEKLGEVSGDLFENIIDKLEKEWFDLIKSLPKKTNDEPALPEDIKCAICDDGECENSNAIVFCDGCNLAVHQDCYGIPYIPEGQWLCRKCMVSPENPVSCIFCPGEGGAFKQTTTNQWGHLLCAIWIPEVGLSNSIYMEPIDNIENVPKSRWKLTCYICRRRHGACIQCDNKHCFVAFHVTCARWARLCMRMKLHGTHYDGVVLKAYCERHTPKDYKEQVDVDKSIADAQRWFTDPKRKKDNLMPRKRYVDEEDDDTYPDLTIDDSSKKLANNKMVDLKQSKKQRRQQAVTQLLPASKAARAHQHQYAAGAPIAPEYILSKLENLPCVRQATHLKKKSIAITSICRYWSLKRESRRGAPLLKRLHLEPWTASASQLKQNEVEKAHKASSMINLRADLEKVRMLSEQVQKRERLKLERIRKQKAYLEMILYPIELSIQPVLDELIELDKKELFRYPVTRDIASDYFDIVKTPMSFTDIIEKLSAHRYLTLDEFEHDLSLIWKNSMLYNKAETPYFKLAQRLEKTMQELMIEARLNHKHNNIVPHSGLLNVDIDPEIFSYAGNEKKLTIDTTLEKENIPHRVPDSSSELSSLSTLSSDSTLQSFVKRRASESLDESAKKRKVSETEERKVTRVTRSKSEREKRSLRSRSITKDMHHPVKTLKSVSRKQRSSPVAEGSVSRKQRSSPVAEGSVSRKQISSPVTEGSIKKTVINEESIIVKKSKHESPPPVRATRSKNHIITNTISKAKTVHLNKESNTESIVVAEEPKTTLIDKTNTELTVTDDPITQPVQDADNNPKTVKFEHGEIVWARVRGFPSHPARIIDPKKRKKIPENVMKLESKQANTVLVEFFEVNETHRWGWIGKKEINPFGDKDVDVEMLTQAKRTKKQYRIKEVKNGYIFACGLQHIDPLPRLALVFKR